MLNHSQTGGWPEQRDAARTLQERLIPFLLISFLILKPAYVFRSGLPQPSDYVMLPLLGLGLLTLPAQIDPRSRQLALWVGLFAAYTVLVNLLWGLLLGFEDFPWTVFYYVYNASILVMVLRVHAHFGEELWRWLAIGTALSLLVHLAITSALGSADFRQTGLFNNPNQLAYWSLLSTSIFFVCATRVEVPGWQKPLVVIAMLLLVAQSLSRAAFVATIPLLAIIALHAKRAPLALAVALIGLLALPVSGPLFDEVADRLEHRREHESADLSDRGYDRIARFPEHLLLGAGEGHASRFVTLGNRRSFELHSTPASIVFSYGLVGTALFLAATVRVVLNGGLYRSLFLIPIFLFGLAHQGLRFPHFWILLAAVGAAAGSDAQGRRATADAESGHRDRAALVPPALTGPVSRGRFSR